MDKVGVVNDSRDAQAIADVANAMRDHMDDNPSAAGYVVNEAVEHFWERPRSTKQGHRTRPRWALWSTKARDVWAKTGGGEGIVGEHVIPRKFVREHLLRLASDGKLDGATALEVLTRIKLAVITVEEAERVKPKQSMPDKWAWEGGDDWARYPEELKRDLAPFVTETPVVEELVEKADEADESAQ